MSMDEFVEAMVSDILDDIRVMAEANDLNPEEAKQAILLRLSKEKK